ncbi:MAG: 50S ribosome-binding GTPase, partial [Planctomycetia bacterium]|nr:50S ribosome-binding GTPase [Planctomycetia bacterium]
ESTGDREPAFVGRRFMSTSAGQRLQILAEMDSVSQSLRDWSDRAPRWSYAVGCQALIRRLLERVELFRARIESPLVVATFGGTGVGKSQLVQALVGAEVVKTGRIRPTTCRPALITSTGLRPEHFGIPPECVELVECDAPAMSHLALIDCPDPDTTDAPEEDTVDVESSNLAALRAILPHCDVLLVVTTQQKYRNARIHEELRAAATGRRFVFVQTHADVDEDIREDWRRILPPGTLCERIFFVDSVAALEAQRRGEIPPGEFPLLIDLLKRELAGTAANRIRRENFHELVMETLDACRNRLSEGMSGLDRLESEIAIVRRQFLDQTMTRLREELLVSRQPWEHRLVEQALNGWGASPLQSVFRAFHRFGDLAFGSLVLRSRTPAQMALWGAVGSFRRWRQNQKERETDQTLSDPQYWGWDPVRLRESSLVIEGYCNDAGLRDRDGERFTTERLVTEAIHSIQNCTDFVATRVQRLLERLASRNAGPVVRFVYEAIFWIVSLILVARPAKNFFIDSWWGNPPAALYGFDFYVLTVGWFLLACFLLYLHFRRRLRRGLQREIRNGLFFFPTSAIGDGIRLHTSLRSDASDAARRQKPWPSSERNDVREQRNSRGEGSGPRNDFDESDTIPGLFATIDRSCTEIHDYRRDLDRIIAQVATLSDELDRTSQRIPRI